MVVVGTKEEHVPRLGWEGRCPKRLLGDISFRTCHFQMMIYTWKITSQRSQNEMIQAEVTAGTKAYRHEKAGCVAEMTLV